MFAIVKVGRILEQLKIFETKLLHNAIASRGIKTYRVQVRRQIPKYKRNLMDLPVLTQYITGRPPGDSLKELWQKKLDTYKNYMPINVQFKPILLEAMFNPANDIDHTLKILDQNMDTMTSFYVATSFEVLDDQMRFNERYRSTVSVAPEFKALCKKALYKVRFFEADEVLKVIKCLATLQVPEDTLIVQSVLQMARHLINDFNHSELEALQQALDSFTLIDDSRKNLLVVLRESIPIAKERQIQAKLYDSQLLDSGLDNSTRRNSS